MRRGRRPLSPWATRLAAGKEFSFQPPIGHTLVLCQAVLECHDEHMERTIYQLTVILGSAKFVSCALRPRFQEQMQISLSFTHENPVKLVVSEGGQGTVHVSGYLHAQPRSSLSRNREIYREIRFNRHYEKLGDHKLAGLWKLDVAGLHSNRSTASSNSDQKQALAKNIGRINEDDSDEIFYNKMKSIISGHSSEGALSDSSLSCS
mmetsp:Transcript_30546/g.44914  ORF Transcript_30546/g.44914 Transcript_30546/m.44914 type:complete len:206 (-) Transcript_30546:142-759(-)